MHIKRMGNKLIKDSFYILVANGITYITTIIITKIISSSFSLTDYGFRSQIITVVSVLASVFSIGLSDAANYFIPLTENNKKRLKSSVFRNIYLVAACVCLISSCIILFFGDFIAVFFENSELSRYRFYIATMVGEQILYSLYAGTQVSQKKALRSTLTNLIRAVVTVLSISIACGLQANINTVIIINIFVDAVFCIYTIVDVTCVRPKTSRWIDLGLIKEILKYCIPLGASSITGMLCVQIDKVFVSKLLTLEDLALYTNMSTELPLAAVSGAFVAVTTPYIVKLIDQKNARKAIDLWGNIVELVSIIILPVITILFVFPRQMIIILYTDEYVVGYQLFRLYAILGLSRITFFGLILRSYGKSLLILICSVLSLIINVAFNAIFYFWFNMGMYGFALATLISTFSVALFQLAVSSYLAKVRFSDIFPWSRLLKCLVINILFGVAAMFIGQLLTKYEGFQVWKFIAVSIVWILTYFLLQFKRMKTLYSLTKFVD